MYVTPLRAPDWLQNKQPSHFNARIELKLNLQTQKQIFSLYFVSITLSPFLQNAYSMCVHYCTGIMQLVIHLLLVLLYGPFYYYYCTVIIQVLLYSYCYIVSIQLLSWFFYSYFHIITIQVLLQSLCICCHIIIMHLLSYIDYTVP